MGVRPSGGEGCAQRWPIYLLALAPLVLVSAPRPVCAEESADVYPQRVIDRPLTLPAGMIEVLGRIGVERFDESSAIAFTVASVEMGVTGKTSIAASLIGSASPSNGLSDYARIAATRAVFDDERWRASLGASTTHRLRGSRLLGVSAIDFSISLRRRPHVRWFLDGRALAVRDNGRLLSLEPRVGQLVQANAWMSLAVAIKARIWLRGATGVSMRAVASMTMTPTRHIDIVGGYETSSDYSAVLLGVRSRL